MGDHGLSSPLLPSDHHHLIVTVHDDNNNNNTDNDNEVRLFRNPFAFLGSGDFSVPVSTTADPFKNQTLEITGVYEWLKIVVCLPIAVARLLLFGASLLIGFVATKLALLGWKDRQNPMPRWRCRIMWITRLCTRCILFAFGYHWIRRKGKPAPRATAPIVVSNHVSFIEPIFYFYELFPTIVASESHDSLPFVGTIIRAMQVIYVNRFSPPSRRQAVSEIKVRSYLVSQSNQSLYAILMYILINPVRIRGHISLARLMFRMFTQFHNFMEVEYLPVVSPLENKKESAFHFAKRTSDTMAAALNVVQTSHSFGDLMLLVKAAQSKSKQVRPSTYMVEMAGIKSLLNISSMEAVDLLDKFLSMNPDPSGHVTYHDFLRVLRLKACAFSEEIFAFIDVDKNRAITFKQFLIGSAHVLKQRLFRQACALAFTECSTGDNNGIFEQRFGESIRHAIPDLNEYEIHELFNLFDIDGDGRISKDDFFTCLRRNPLLIALFSPCLIDKDFSEDSNRLLEEIV